MAESPTGVWGTILPILAGLIGGFGAGKTGGSGSAPTTDNSAITNAMLQDMMTRSRLQNPLYEETTQLMRSLMPKSSRPTTYQLPDPNAPLPPPWEGPPKEPNGPQPASLPFSSASLPMSSASSPGGQAWPTRRPPNQALEQALQALSGGLSGVGKAQLFRR